MIEPDVEKADVYQPCGGVQWAFEMPQFGIWFSIHRGCSIHYWDITCLFCRSIIEQRELVSHNCRSSLFKYEHPRTSRAKHLRNNPIFPNTSDKGT